MIEFLLTIIVIVLVSIVVIVGIGIFVLCKIVGGFGNLKKIVSAFTGWGKTKQDNTKKNSKRPFAESSKSSDNSSTSETSSRSAGTGGKMFNKNEGTYVDFEEIK